MISSHPPPHASDNPTTGIMEIAIGIERQIQGTCSKLHFSPVLALYERLRMEQMSNFEISIQSSNQVTDLVDKNFFYKFCRVHIFPISVIEGVAFVWILKAPSSNQDRKILYVIKNVAKVAYYKIH